MKNICILAQNDINRAPAKIPATNSGSDSHTTALTSSDANTPPPQPRPRGLFSDTGSLIFFILLLVVFYFVLFRGPRKRQQEHKQMVQSLKKNDKVRTIGGIIGTVIDIKDDEIVLKVDESNNTKIRVILSAIGKKLSDEKSSNTD